MRITRGIPVVAASVAAALTLAACGGAQPEPEATDGGAGGAATAPLLTIGHFQEVTSWDPAQASEGNIAPYYQAVYDTLIKREPDGSLSPMLAESWEPSEDGLTWTLELRDDVTFSDGAAFDAEAAVANVEHFKSANGPMAGTLGAVTGVEAIGDHTVELTLSQPDPGLPYALSNAAGYMGSPEALGTEGITTEPVGSGPYVLDAANSVAGSRIAFDRNEEYWGDPLPFDEIDFMIFTDETARLNALRTGQVMAAKLTQSASAVEAESAGFDTELNAINWDGVIFFDRDGQEIPELADPRVREALAISIDREAIIEAVALGRAEETAQTFGPATDGYIEELDTAYEYDPERARELLAEAGAEDLSITIPTSPVFDPAIYNALEQNWEDIGVTVDTFQWGPGEALPSMLGGEWPIVWMSLSQQPDWPHIKFEIAPDAPWNPFGTETDELNTLIEEYQHGDDASRPQTAEAINQYLVDEFWFAPVMRSDSPFFWDGDVVNVELQASQAQPSIYNYSPAS